MEMSGSGDGGGGRVGERRKGSREVSSRAEAEEKGEKVISGAPSQAAPLAVPAMASTLDFRFLDEGIGGQRNKRKRVISDGAEGMDLDDAGAGGGEGNPLPLSKRPALPSLEDPDKPASFGRPTYDGVIAGKVSGRKWKQVRQQRASAVRVSRRGKSLEQRTKEKEIKRAFQDRVRELKEEIRQSKVEKRKRREEREKKKKENILRSGTKLQKITKPKTLQKIAKSKQRKQLRVVDDALVNKGKKKVALDV